MPFLALRKKVRQLAVDTLRSILLSHEGRQILVDSLSSLLASPHRLNADGLLQSSKEYPDLPNPTFEKAETDRHAPVFITARFRSGSTLLWNLFRHVPDCTAYYEPLNERRWFDPQTRGTRVDCTHRNVQDYWREYAGLEHLGKSFRDDWNERRLYMDASTSDPQLLAYVRALIEHASGRAVLQFNRVDFRLPWLRHHFPHAKIVHLSRHPRDSWYSSLMSKDRCPRDLSIAQFAKYDELYLLHWLNDLRLHFPILHDPAVEHPYQVYYCLWKLSFAFGVEYADYHLSYENLVKEPQSQIRELLTKLDLNPQLATELAKLVEPTRPSSWHEYADQQWFLEKETICEQLFGEYYLPTRDREQRRSTLAVS